MTAKSRARWRIKFYHAFALGSRPSRGLHKSQRDMEVAVVYAMEAHLRAASVVPCAGRKIGDQSSASIQKSCALSGGEHAHSSHHSSKSLSDFGACDSRFSQRASCRCRTDRHARVVYGRRTWATRMRLRKFLAGL